MSTEPYDGYDADRRLKYCERRLSDILNLYADAYAGSDAVARGLSRQRVREMVRGSHHLRMVFGITREGNEGVPADGC